MRLSTWCRALAVLVPLLAAPLPARAQSIKDLFSQLFIFGSGQDPLFLAGSANPDNPASIQEHGNHFIPSAVASNGSLISFLTNAIGSSVSDVPIGSSSGGQTFRFEGGVPTPTSTSAGPVFAERAQTLGRGRLLVGAGHSDFNFTSLRGVPLSNMQLYFTHENVNFAGCDTIYHDSCAKMGVPTLENDIMQFNLNVDLDVSVTSLYATYGITDRLDFGVVVPLVDTHLSGNSLAQIIPFGGPTAAHFFGGTPADPVLSATRTVQGAAFGLGDVVARAKYWVAENPNVNVALYGEARFPTGSETDLLGAGAFSARGLAIVSAHVGQMNPHLNVGYGYRASNLQTDVVTATAGFDQLIASHLTLAADVLSDLQVGDSKLILPAPVQYQAPFQRTVDPTDIPNMRDDLVNGSFGFKYSAAPGYSILANILVPLNKGGLRTTTTYTAGLEYTF